MCRLKMEKFIISWKMLHIRWYYDMFDARQRIRSKQQILCLRLWHAFKLKKFLLCQNHSENVPMMLYFCVCCCNHNIQSLVVGVLKRWNRFWQEFGFFRLWDIIQMHSVHESDLMYFAHVKSNHSSITLFFEHIFVHLVDNFRFYV